MKCFISKIITLQILQVVNLKINQEIIFILTASVFIGADYGVQKNQPCIIPALGTYDNFELENDAGYINDFHTDTNNIIGMQNYKEYLAIYKKDKVYLLSGSNPSDFAVTTICR